MTTSPRLHMSLFRGHTAVVPLDAVAPGSHPSQMVMFGSKPTASIAATRRVSTSKAWYCRSRSKLSLNMWTEFAPANSDLYGYATMENGYAEEDKGKLQPVGKQIQFAGLFPVENPRYCICIVADKNSLDASLAELGDVVNPLAKWLLKR